MKCDIYKFELEIKLTIALMHTYKLMSIICYIIKSDVATEMLLMSLN